MSDNESPFLLPDDPVPAPDAAPGLDHAALADRTGDIAIKVIGIGGAGANCVDRLKMENLDRLNMAVINTDYQALSTSPVQEKILIGSRITRGLGAGGEPDLGRTAAEHDREKIAAAVKDNDLVFLIAGMGGGTGSGAAPTVAEIATETGALVIAFVTQPFNFEGARRIQQADDALAALRKVCDAVIPLPNDILLQEAAEGETALDSFARADAWIGRAVKAIWSMLHRTGLINLDFATLRQAFHTRGGKTLFGLASGNGPHAVTDAIEGLKRCPLLATPDFARKADRLLVNIVGGASLSLSKVNDIMTAITEQFGRDPHVIMGAVIDEDMQDRVEVVILGTTEPGNRGYTPRRNPAVRTRSGTTTAAARAAELDLELAAAETPASTTDAQENAPAKTASAITGSAKRPATHASKLADKGAQDEFAFGEVQNRGSFEQTDRNLHFGQDLDVPTYLRKGIKIVL